jgi:hypothetical protein
VKSDNYRIPDDDDDVDDNPFLINEINSAGNGSKNVGFHGSKSEASKKSCG